ncbi:MAG: NAD(P)-binding domain-containing protein [Candidatus Nanopelagicales bacterium]
MTRYCIIGAGPAGLATLKTMRDSGHDVDCFEMSDTIGGHWNHDYDALHLITSRQVTGFEGFPMPEDWPLFPHRNQMLEYFHLFADAFDLKSYITFNTGVTSVEPLATDGPVGSAGWAVTTTDGLRREYDGVLVANGHLRDQKRPHIPGEFTGKQIHSGSYQNTANIEGKRVLVIGSGNSGCDVAVDAAQGHFDTHIVIRRGHHFQPKTFFGKPRSELGWMQEFSFEEQDLLSRLMMRVAIGEASDYPGMPIPDHRALADGPPVVNDLLLYWVQHGRITVRPGIERFQGKTVYFEDGSSSEFDTILWATGFHASLPFIDSDLLEFEDGVPLRVGGAVVPVGLEKLYLIGMIGARGPQPPIYPLQAELALRMIALHEAADGGFMPIAGPLTQAQEHEWRIDILRPLWLDQVQQTSVALQVLSASQNVSVSR